MSDPSRTNLLASRSGRRVLFAALYLSEGAPIGFIWWALPTRLREDGVPVSEIASLAAFSVLPWALKFLWAPLVDTLRTDRWGLRAWIIFAQLMMGLTLIPLFDGSILANVSLLRWLLFTHALCAATQDVAVDALCISTVPTVERGTLNGLMQAAMLLGRALFGGGSLLIFGLLGHRIVIAMLIIATWTSTILVVLAVRESVAPDDGSSPRRLEGFLHSLSSAVCSPATWLGLVFAATAGAGFEAIGAVAGPFLIDRGLARDTVGIFFAGPTIVLMLAGSLLWGWASNRDGRRSVSARMIAALSAAGLFLALAAWRSSDTSHVAVISALSMLYFMMGLFTAASYTLLMNITDPRLGATQFSAFMGATNFCEAWSAMVGGRLVDSLGYPAMFAIMSGLTLVAIPTLRGLSEAQSRAQHAGRMPV